MGVCVLAEFGRFLLYNLLVDGGSDNLEDSSDSDEENEEGNSFRGYKQMLLILQSQGTDTGKSFLSEVLATIFHGKKYGIQSTLSFDVARGFLCKGEPIIIDDYNNDEVGSVLLSRASKSIWGRL